MAVCSLLSLHGGDRFEITVTPNQSLTLKPKKTIDANDPAYKLGREILEAEGQIKRGETVSWADIKHKHHL